MKGLERRGMLRFVHFVRVPLRGLTNHSSTESYSRNEEASRSVRSSRSYISSALLKLDLWKMGSMSMSRLGGGIQSSRSLNLSPVLAARIRSLGGLLRVSSEGCFRDIVVSNNRGVNGQKLSTGFTDYKKIVMSYC